MTWRRSLPWLAALLALAAWASGVRPPGSGPGAGGAGGSASGRVTRVVDGDTIHVSLGGRDETVRYIGMDTPETVKPNTPVQCFGPRAHDANTRLVDGQEVSLRFDAERRDRYGRLLAYVFRARDGMFVNAALVRGGYARTLRIPPNTARASQLDTLQARARRTGRGLWRACGGDETH